MKSASFLLSLFVLTSLPNILLAQARPPVAAADLVVRDAWMREATAGQASTSAYVVIENKSATATALTSVDAAVAGTVELHTMKMTGGMSGMSGMGGDMMTMEKVPEVPIGARSTVALKPGSFHIMLFKVSKAAPAGSTASTER